MSDKCPVCGEGPFIEVIEDSVGSFGTITLGAKHSKCEHCGFEGTNGTQMDHNAKCETIELHGPFKPIVVDAIHNADVYFDWGWKGCGFGQLSFHYDRETKKITCMDECMGREGVRKLLYALADYIANTAVLDGDDE